MAEGAELENRNKENYYNPNEEVIFELDQSQECQSDGVLLNWRDQESYFWILTHYKQNSVESRLSAVDVNSGKLLATKVQSRGNPPSL